MRDLNLEIWQFGSGLAVSRATTIDQSAFAWKRGLAVHAVGNCILLVSMADLKYGKLEGAFLYALDESMNSIGAADLEQCFGDNLKALGNNIQMAFVNMISRTEKRMENEFQHISAKHRVRAALARSYTPPPPADTARCTHDSERSLLEAKKALMRAELDEVANRIRLLVRCSLPPLPCSSLTPLSQELESKRSMEVVGRLRTQLYNEIEALNEQSMKLERVTDHCT